MRISLGVSFVAAVCISTLGWAQERGEERNPPVVRPASGAIAHAVGTADQQIAAFLFGCTRNEVEISKIAQDKATSEEVRDFAAMMVKDHTPGMEKLQQLAGPLVSVHAPGTPAAGVKKEIESTEEIKEETREPRRDPAGKNSPVAAPREAREAAPGGFNWVTVHKQLADQCLASAKTELQKKDGAEFDHCYIGQEIMGHAMKLDTLKVLRTYASAELRKDIDEASQTATQHLEQAKKIAENMKKEFGERVSRKPKAE